MAESLVDSSLVGHDTHGVIRIAQYVQAIERGYLRPAAQPQIVKETASTCLVDGNWAFGQVSGELAMRRALEQAKRHGIAIAGLTCAYHIGRLGEYSEMACKEGMISMVLAGGFHGVGGASAKAGVAPFGGARPAFGTNPISFGIPAGNQPGVLVDFATSAVAAGKVALAKAKGVPLPENCVMDKEGKPTTNADDFYAGGMLLPFGARKGYGLAVVIEQLGQVLTGSDLCREESLGAGVFTKSGSVFVAIDPGLFRPLAEFVSAADMFLDRIKNVPPAPGFKEVLVPGAPEYGTRSVRIAAGISVPEGSWQVLQQQAVKYGVDLTAAMG